MTIQTAIQALSALLGERLSQSMTILEQHGASESYYPLTPPDAVVFPQNTAEVSEIIKICAAHDCPVIAFGTGTSLEGHQLAVQGGISLDLSRMNAVLAVNAEDMDAVVQPGVTREQLNQDLRATGLFFPVDPGANASLGGMAATRASGTTALRYGTMKENVMALEVVLADGRIIRTGSRARKSSAGYDLTKLMIGSEGTLGIITELTLRLQGQPEAISAATCAFPAVADAVNTVITTIQSGIPMARMELIDANMVRGFNIADGTALPEQPHLFVEFHGSESGVAEQAERFAGIVQDFGGSAFKWALKAEDRAALWKMRHNAFYAHKALAPTLRAMATDICVPISRLAEAIEFAEVKSRELGLTCTIIGHVGDGNFHCALSFDREDAVQFAKVQDFMHQLAETAIALNGTITGEHGVGIGKMKYMQAEHGGALDTMRLIKRALDPQNILNPGKLIPPSNTGPA